MKYEIAIITHLHALAPSSSGSLGSDGIIKSRSAEMVTYLLHESALLSDVLGRQQA
jgi:hypothetical protein